MIEYYPDSIYYPRETVVAKYQKGELAKIEERLMEFARRHRNRIWIISKEDSSEPSNEILLDNLRATKKFGTATKNKKARKIRKK